MNPFDIFVTYIAWGSDGKHRPVLAFIVGEDVVDMYQITTKYEGKSAAIQEQYFKITDWVQAGLDAQSYVDTGTLIALTRATFRNKRPLGKLTDNDKRRFLEFLSN